MKENLPTRVEPGDLVDVYDYHDEKIHRRNASTWPEIDFTGEYADAGDWILGTLVDDEEYFVLWNEEYKRWEVIDG